MANVTAYRIQAVAQLLSYAAADVQVLAMAMLPRGNGNYQFPANFANAVKIINDHLQTINGYAYGRVRSLNLL